MRYRYLLDCVKHGVPSPVCPVSMWKHHPVCDQQGDTLAEATVAFQNKFDFDFVKISPASTYQLRDPLGRRGATRPVVTSPDDWRRLPRLDPGRGFAAKIVQGAAQIRRTLPPHVPIVMTVFNPLFQAVMLADFMTLRSHIEQDPDAVSAGLEIIAANTLRLIERFCDVGVDGIFLAVQHAQAAQFSAPDYRRHALAQDLACLETAAALPFNMVHLHGSAVHLDLFGAHGSTIVHYDAAESNPDPVELLGSSRYTVSTGPSGPCFMPGQSLRTLLDQVDALLDRCKGPGFILGAGCTLPRAAADDWIESIVARARLARPDRRPTKQACVA